MSAPAQLDVVEGLAASLEVVLSGGASRFDAVTYVSTAPTQDDRAIIDWQRSDDGGGSWRIIARSFQDEANPKPVGGLFAWGFWSVHHGFVATAADQGALVRVSACYTPLDVPAPPCVIGPATRLNVLQQSALPSIVDAPRSVLVTTGQTASFSAIAGGAPAPTLQWQIRAANDTGRLDRRDRTGATTGSYTTAALTIADNGRQFRVVASNAVGTAESVPVTVSVSELDVAPTIITQPASLSVTAGSDAVFAVAARGTEVMGYQWRLDGTPIAGANGPVLRLAAVTAAAAGGYSVVVSNAAGTATSDVATLTVGAGVPAVVAPDHRHPAGPGDRERRQHRHLRGRGERERPARLPVAEGRGRGSRRHQRRPHPGRRGRGQRGRLLGRGLELRRQRHQRGRLARVDHRVAADPDSAVITTQPSTLVVMPGGAATLAVAASGSGPLAYQWSLEGSPVAGATGPVPDSRASPRSRPVSYTVTVRNGAGSVTSTPAPLILVGAPAHHHPPGRHQRGRGEHRHLLGRGHRRGAALPVAPERPAEGGATGQHLTTLATALADSGAVFAVLVYNAAGLVLSQPAVLTVTAAPVVTGPAKAGKLAASYRHTCAVLADTTLACWGYNSSGQIGAGSYSSWPTPYLLPLTGVTSVAAGQSGTCAIHGAGDLSCWGSAGNSNRPVAVAGFTGVLGVTVGASHACLVSSGGGVFCWGNNTSNQLGDGTTTNSSVPVQVQASGGLALSGVVAVSAGFATTCALRGDATVACWGSGFGAVAAPVAGLSSITALSAGPGAPCALSSDGTVRCWSAAAPTPVVVAGLTGVTALASGSQHHCAVLGDGTTWCWGTAPMGNGNASETQPTPTKVTGLAKVGVVAAGLEHTCALRTDRTLTCWGANSEGQLATGDTFPRFTPSDVPSGAIFWGP